MHISSSFSPVSFLLKAVLLSLFFLILIQPGLSIRFASSGLSAWYQTVVPTLLPCMLLSSLIIQTNAASLLTPFIHPVLGRLFATSSAGSYCLLMGFLCGYPMGAKTCADMIKTRALSEKEGRYLMAFLHFPSPMFVTGYIAASNLILPSSLPILAAIYLPAIPLSLLSRLIHSGYRSSDGQIKDSRKIRPTPSMLDDVIAASSAVMIKIGVYMMLFTILAGFARMLPLPAQVFGMPSEALISALCGLLEMTTGIRLAAQTVLPLTIKGSLICFAAAFGGLSVVMQIQSVLADSGLSLRDYLPWQILHGVLAALIFFLTFPLI